MVIAFQFYDQFDYTGGPTVNAFRLLCELNKSEHEIHALVLYNKDYPNARKLMELGVKCHVSERMHYTEDQVKWYAGLIEEIQPDVFVTNTSTSAAYLAPYLRKAGIPTVITHRTPDPLAQNRAAFFSANKDYMHTAMVCVSKFLENELIKKTKSNILTEVIPSGVPDSKHFAVQTYPPYAFVYAGRFMERPKRLAVMLESIAALQGLQKKVTLTMVGGNETELKTYSKIIRNLGIYHIVKLKNKITGDDYKKELSKHNFILLFSEFEGMPGAIMDGMSCGLIPIVANFNGIDELVKHEENGFIIKNLKEDFLNLMMKIERNEYNLKAISNRAIKTINSNYSIVVATAKWIDLLEKITSQSNKSHFTLPLKIKLPPKRLKLYGDFRKPTLIEKIRFKLKIRTRIMNLISNT